MGLIDKYLVDKHLKKSKFLIINFKNQQQKLQIGRPISDFEVQEALNEWISLLNKFIIYKIICALLLLVILVIIFNL